MSDQPAFKEMYQIHGDRGFASLDLPLQHGHLFYEVLVRVLLIAQSVNIVFSHHLLIYPFYVLVSANDGDYRLTGKSRYKGWILS